MVRRRPLLACFVAALAVLLMLAVPVAAAPAPDPSADPIEPTSVEWLSDRFAEVSFDNPRVDPPVSPTKVRILLPDGWQTSRRAYPAILLLHGAGDRFDGWTTKQDGWSTTLEEFTADQDVVIVMPDGGTADEPGWYSDWFNGGDFGSPQWETWHIAQLLPWVKDTFPVRTDRGGWVVAGLSMGGFGTMSYLARHPDEFAAGFSFSGALNTRPEGDAGVVAPQGVWGNEVEQEVRYRGHNPTDLVPNLHDAEEIWFRTAQGAPGGPAPRDNDPAGLGIEAGAWQTNEKFALALADEGLDHHYEAFPQGGHNWWHWHDGLQNHAWPLIMDVFERDVPDVPDDFDYRTIESVFEVYGWEVSVDRDVVEFLALTDVDRDDLTVTGSGTVTVTTPAAYEPGAVYRVSASGASTVEPAQQNVVADRAGRLTYTVTLGPSHEHQQYTAPQRAAEAGDPDYWQTADVTVRLLARPGKIVDAGGSGGSDDTTRGGAPDVDPDDGTLPSTGGGAVLVALTLMGGALLRRR
jgi:S-formylglutathione hydrolase FrmB